MAERVVELTLASYEAFLSGDVDRFVSLYHPECEWDVSRYDGWGGDPTYSGRGGLRRFHAQWVGTFEDLHTEPERLIELEDDGILVGKMPKRVYVCTRCLKAGKVTKAV